MILPSYGALKLTNITVGAISTLALVLDPTVQVAIIVSIPPTITGIATIILMMMNRTESRKALQEIKVDVNSNFSRMLDEKAKQDERLKDQGIDLITTTKDLGRAEG